MISLTDGIAFYAAVASTVALVWDVIKWRNEVNPKLRVDVTPGMLLIDGHGNSSEPKIIFQVTNIGGITTTVKNVTGHWYKNYFDFMRKKPSMNFVVNPYLTQEIPYELTTGQEWTGGLNQTEFVERYKTGYVTFGIHHTISDKPMEKTLSLKDILNRGTAKPDKSKEETAKGQGRS